MLIFNDLMKSLGLLLFAVQYAVRIVQFELLGCFE